MKLLIHDYTPEEFAPLAAQYDGWDIVSDDGTIRPCIGCFGCWIKTPGQCVIPDAYQTMARRIHAAEEVVVCTKWTYGGFSPFVKNVFDRSIGVVLPFFEIVDGEMHHQKRYPEAKPITVHFRGSGLDSEKQALSRRYVDAVCLNLQGMVKGVTFEELPAPARKQADDRPVSGTVLLSGSLRGKAANSRALLQRLNRRLGAEIVDLVSFHGDYAALAARLRAAETIVLATPLYVDGLPSAVLRLLSALEQDPGGKKRVYAIGNLGFYESRQIQNLLAFVRSWCEQCGYVYGGGLAVGAGAMNAQLLKLPGAKNAVAGLERFASAILDGRSVNDHYEDSFLFPRAAYVLAANHSWIPKGKKNGLTKEELRRG